MLDMLCYAINFHEILLKCLTPLIIFLYFDITVITVIARHHKTFVLGTSRFQNSVYGKLMETYGLDYWVFQLSDGFKI